MNGQPRIVFIGAERVGLACLTRLMAMGRNIVGVFTADEGLRPRIADFVPFPDQRVPVFRITSSSADTTVRAIQSLKPDLILVVSWSQIIPQSILSAAPLGCVGLHYSLLPARRGGAPLTWAILDGLTETGITLFYMDEGVDTGDIIAQTRFAIGPRDTVGTLLETIVRLAPELVAENIEAIERGMAPRRRQDEAQATFTEPRRPHQSEIDWGLSLDQLDRFIRALAPPYPSAFTNVGHGRRIVIESSRPAAAPGRLHITGYIE